MSMGSSSTRCRSVDPVFATGGSGMTGLAEPDLPGTGDEAPPATGALARATFSRPPVALETSLERAAPRLVPVRLPSPSARGAERGLGVRGARTAATTGAGGCSVESCSFDSNSEARTAGRDGPDGCRLSSSLPTTLPSASPSPARSSASCGPGSTLRSDSPSGPDCAPPFPRRPRPPRRRRRRLGAPSVTSGPS